MDRIIRGPWLNSALEEIANDSDARNRDMARYRQPPPPYTSPCRSAATTEFEVPDFEEPQAPLTRSELRLKLQHERCASCPYHQFMDQWNDGRREVENEVNKNMLSGRLDPMYVGPGRGPDSMSHQRVKERWVEQGIWRDNWSEIPKYDWKHEEPPESDSCSDSEIESETPACAAPFSFSSNPPRPRLRPRPNKSDQKIREAAERREIGRGIREKERNASRPFEQFLYQLRRESKRLEADLRDTVTMNLDINALAFQNVQ
ncbi:hypothetical protein MAA_08627 [Metarhizium robertsii ARSEF 23]|uniref:Uncharacterized protein n=1 Tax=Metarhizium robertsii (strain ARSEF 23 / ATCC MYA-3075) TaxID=655844 RepID=E9F8M8_METRA|nr:uncharacterized protein MAA_08627 [Metarhizium robertsii ARSEF 23]EFY95974.1 hypothetical protein MAA_08627 [Metarhizium robertsii ARSEF 23]